MRRRQHPVNYDRLSEYELQGEFCVGTKVPGALAAIEAQLAAAAFEWFRPDSLSGNDFQSKITSSKLISTGASPATFDNSGPNGRARAVFNGTPYYVSNRPLADWTFMSDGTPCLWAMVLRSTSQLTTHRLLVTQTGSDPGMDVLLNNSNTGRIQSRVYAALPVDDFIVNNSLNSTMPLNTWTYITQSFSTAATPDQELCLEDSSIASGNASAAPSSGAPGQSLSLGANAAGLTPGEFDFADLIIAKDLSLLALMRSYIALRYLL